MYTTMLEEAVRKMKGEEDKPAHAGTAINLGISVRIDADYIPEENQRLRIYKKIAGAETQANLVEIREELQDRYGTPPDSVLNLLAAAEIRLHCEQLGISQLDRKRTQIELPNPANKKQPLKSFVEMLHVKFAEALSGGAPATAPGTTPAPDRTVDPGLLMRLVSRNAKKGAQFTPQGILRWPLTAAKAEIVLAETRALLDALTTGGRE
jgi:transcription-repair coupling factor (superfamily II helicase)